MKAVHGLSNYALISTLTLGVVLLAVGAAAGTTIAPGVVSWWPGDENANDIVDGNNGTLQLGATFADGKVGQAFSLDGIDDFVLVPHNSNLAFGSGQDFTIDAWINLQAPVADHDDEIVAKWNVQNSRVDPSHNFYRLFLQRDTHKVRLGLGSAGVGYELESNFAVPLNQWTHVVALREGNVGRIYINGVLDAAAIMTAGTVANSDPLAIGGVFDTLFSPPVQVNHTFGGLIDEVEIYERALSASEIQSIFEAGNAGNKPTKLVTICHKPGTPAEKTNIVPFHSLAGHLGHGDNIGACQ